MPLKTFNRLRQIDYYIQQLNTGEPKDFGKKLHISERQVHRYITLMRKLGAPILFCKKRKTYYYSRPGSFNFIFNDAVNNAITNQFLQIFGVTLSYTIAF